MQWNHGAGKPPSQKALREAANLAALGSKTHLVIAMALRPNGLTQQEVIMLFGHPYRNKLRQLAGSPKVEVVMLPDGTRSKRIKLIPKVT